MTRSDLFKFWQSLTSSLTTIMLLMTFVIPATAQDSNDKKRLAEELPGHITQVTNFGQRADWSHDGKRILFIEKTYGDVFEAEVLLPLFVPLRTIIIMKVIPGHSIWQTAIFSFPARECLIRKIRTRAVMQRPSYGFWINR